MTPGPAVAVVVSTYNRAHLLGRLVDALAAQEGVDSFEVVIVDDCSTDDTWATLQELVVTVPFPLQVLRTERNSGPASGRNLGWRASQAPLVAFTDDDCAPDPKWLAAVVAGLEHADVVQGYTDLDRAGLGRGPFARRHWVVAFTWLFETCNIGYRRLVLERLGGFDEVFRRPFGEDVDLGWRAIEAGYTTAWVPEALVVHDVESTGSHLRDWMAWVKDTRRREFAVLMVKRHPGLRQHVYRRWFYKAHHPPTIAALVGLGLVASAPGRRRRWLAGVCLAAPWLRFRLLVEPRAARPRALPAVLPMTFVGDVAELAVLLRGSVKYRTVLI